MGYENIEKLLEKYWQAETNLEEEQTLRSFFAYAEVPAHLKAYQPYFGGLAERQQEASELDSSFDEELLSRLSVTEKKSIWLKYNVVFKIAATLLLVVSLAVVVYRNNPSATTEPRVLSSYESTEQAYQETKKALLMMSSNLNRGTKITENSLGKIDSVKNIIRYNKQTSK